MVEKLYGKFFLICDVCGERHDEECDTFEYAVLRGRLTGWRATQKSGEWMNICPECQEVQ